MITRKLSTATLLICIVHGVHFVISEPAAVASTRTAIKVPALTRSAAQTSSKKPATKSVDPTRRTSAPIAAKDLDGRSAYINNQYIGDEEQPPATYNDTSRPLYQFLQEQMEHILATSLPGEYQLQNNQAHIGSSSDDVDPVNVGGYGVPALQISNNSPGFGYGSGTTETEDDESIQDPHEKKKEKEENSFHGTIPTRPVLELPKPISVENEASLQPESKIKISNNKNYSLESKHPTAEYGSQLTISPFHPDPPITQQDAPQFQAEAGYGSQLQSHKSHIKQDQSSSPNKLTYVQENSTLTMRKRRITFKTISTSSQIISTPMADLLFKYSIGIAKPSLGGAGNSLENIHGISDPMRKTLPKICDDKVNPLSYKKPGSHGYIDRTLYGRKD